MMSGAFERAGDVGEYEKKKKKQKSGFPPRLHHVPLALLWKPRVQLPSDLDSSSISFLLSQTRLRCRRFPWLGTLDTT